MAPDSGLPHPRPATRGSHGSRNRLVAGIEAARARLLARQHPEGYWQYELEADCTIPAEYILMLHYLGESDRLLESRLAAYLRDHQSRDGGWPLYPGGAMDVSCSVKCYYALKLAGDRPDAPHMLRARSAILAQGGAACSNVFTRIALALFGELPWRGVPFLPVEIVLLPHWFPFNLMKVSYWSRTVMVPLSVLTSLKPRAANPGGVHIRELFVTPPEQEKHYFRSRSLLNRLLFACEGILRRGEALIPRRLRRRALKRAEAWILERRNGDGGLGAIFPAMVNAYEALALLGYPADHPARRETRKAIDDLLVIHDQDAWCQPCVSPIWDTGLTCLAMQEDPDAPQPAIRRALDWFVERQLLEAPGDWRSYRRTLPGGGWAFQFRNDAYPDLDDTAVVARAMHQSPDRAAFAKAIGRAADWLAGMQSRNGGFAAFDADNDHEWLNQIPFADHGALLDPPTSDVSGRVLTLLSLLGRPRDRDCRERVLRFLLDEQTPEGAWFGRWGTNYIYGTWSVVVALRAAGLEVHASPIMRAAEWLKSVQQADGGWGEGNDSYLDPTLRGRGARSGPGAFSELHSRNPDVRLEVFSSFSLYGWDERDRPFQPLFDFCENHPAITYRGAQENDVVRLALSRSHVLAYPSTWEETSCLCLIEAMSSDLVCCHSNLGALPETAANWTMMYPFHEDPTVHAGHFLTALETAVGVARDRDWSKVSSQKLYTDTFYNWELRVAQWEALIRSLLDENRGIESTYGDFEYEVG